MMAVSALRTKIVKKIRVVHIVPMLSPGGAERVAVHIVRGLSHRRYEPVVISFSGRLGCDLDYLLDDAGIEVRYLGKRSGFDYRMYHRLPPVLSELEPDIVHTHLHVLRYALPFLLFRRRASLVHTVHNLAEREIEPRLRWLQRYALKHGVVPVAVGGKVADSLGRLYGIQRCRVIPNGIPTDRYSRPQVPRKEWRAREGFSENEVLFVCVARFFPQKNHALLLSAFAQGPASDPNAHLVLVGEGVLQKNLEVHAKNLGIERQVHFLGLRADIPNVLGAADVFVLSSDYEGNPLSVMEAMAAGLPIVSTAAGGVPDLFDSGREGLVVPPGDLQSLSKAMAFLAGDRGIRQSLGVAAVRRATANFDVSKMVKAYEGLYEELVNHSHYLYTNERRPQESAIPAE